MVLHSAANMGGLTVSRSPRASPKLRGLDGRTFTICSRCENQTNLDGGHMLT